METFKNQTSRRDQQVTWIAGKEEPTIQIAKPSCRVQIGTLVETHSVLKQVNPIDIRNALNRHKNGDWGLVSSFESYWNDYSLDRGNAVLSAFQDQHSVRFWIETSADRSRTVVMLPCDYRQLHRPPSIRKIVERSVGCLLAESHRNARWLFIRVLPKLMSRVMTMRFVISTFLLIAIPEVLYYLFQLMVMATRDVQFFFANL